MSQHGPVDEYVTLTHEELLRNAARERRTHGLDDYFIVDADFHHNEATAWAEMLAYLDDDVMHRFLTAGGKGQPWLPALVANGGIQDVAGRIKPQRVRDAPSEDGSGATGAARLLEQITDTRAAMGTSYVLLFPTELLNLGTNPFADLEADLARAYARWVTENVLDRDPSVLTLLYLPFGHPEACVELIEEFGDRQGVVGFMITSVRRRRLYERAYMPVYAALQERSLVLGFHTAFDFYAEPSTEQLNRFLSIHTLGFPHFQMIQMLNWVVNGLPVRFPDLRVLFIEGGLACVPFVMERLDHEFRMRRSEAPLLERLPSDYLRECWFTSQPLESAENPRYLQTTFEMINAETQLLYASDWPHWDFDLPSRIARLPFLDERAKRQILGENGARLFGLEVPAQRAGAQPQAERDPASPAPVASPMRAHGST